MLRFFSLLGVPQSRSSGVELIVGVVISSGQRQY